MSALKNPERDVYGALVQLNANTTTPSSASITSNTSTALPDRVLWDTVNHRPLPEAQRVSERRVWVLSSRAAELLFTTLLTWPITLSAQSPPIVSALAGAAHALFTQTRAALESDCAQRVFATALCQLTAGHLAALTADDRTHAALTEPLQQLTAAVGQIARLRSVPVAGRIVADSRTTLGPNAIANFSPTSYLSQYSEPGNVGHRGGRTRMRMRNTSAKRRTKRVKMKKRWTLTDGKEILMA